MSKKRHLGKTGTKATKRRPFTLDQARNHSGVVLFSEDWRIFPCEGTSEAVQKALNGAHIERIRLTNGSYLLVDEEGKLKGLPFNFYASEIVKAELVGPVVYVPRHLVREVLGHG